MTAAQLREVTGRLIEAGHWTRGDPDILLVMDAGYDVTRLAHLLSDLPLELIGRLRSDRVMLRDAGEPRSTPRGGRPRKHGTAFTFAKPESWHEPDTTTRTETTRYGKAEARAWDRMHQRLQKRRPWLDHEGEIPITHGTLVRLKVEHLPGEREAKPLWLWSSATGIDTTHLDRIWRTFLRRFDLEHTFRLLKGTLGWTAPHFRAPDTADLWTWLVIVAHTQLRLARLLAAALRRPWLPGPPSRRHRDQAPRHRPQPQQTPRRHRKIALLTAGRGKSCDSLSSPQPECRNPPVPAPDGHRHHTGARAGHRRPGEDPRRPSDARPCPGRAPGRRRLRHPVHHPPGQDRARDRPGRPGQARTQNPGTTGLQQGGRPPQLG